MNDITLTDELFQRAFNAWTKLVSDHMRDSTGASVQFADEFLKRS